MNLFFKTLNLTERISAYMQGKGYGSATVRQEIKLLESFLNSEPKISIDIGGNIGNYTAELRRRFPSLEIHTFEPSSTNILKLNTRFAHDQLIHIVPFAVSDSNETATLYSDKPGSGLGSLKHRQLDHFNIDFNTTEKINTIKFDDYWTSKLGSRPINIAKLDIEGFELAALKGFGRALNATNLIQFEFGGCNIDTRTYFQDFWYFFKEQDFDLYRITPLGLNKISKYTERDELFITANYIALNKNWAK